MRSRSVHVLTVGCFLFGLGGLAVAAPTEPARPGAAAPPAKGSPRLEPVEAPASSVVKLAPALRAATQADPVAVAKKRMPRITKVQEYVVELGPNLNASSASAVSNGKAAFTTSTNGFVTLTLNAKDKMAYGVRCASSVTDLVKFDPANAKKPAKDRPASFSCRAYANQNLPAEERARLEQECADMTANHPTDCTFSQTDPVGNHNFTCKRTEIKLEPNSVTSPSWSISQLEGASWKPVAQGQNEQPNAFVIPGAGAKSLKIAYDIAGKKSDTLPCNAQKTLMLSTDPRPYARYPRLVELCSDGVRPAYEDLRWELTSCTVTELALE